MLMRLIVTTGVFALGYYLGREVGRQMPVQRELDEARLRGDIREVGASTGGAGDRDLPSDGETRH